MYDSMYQCKRAICIIYIMYIYICLRLCMNVNNSVYMYVYHMLSPYLSRYTHRWISHYLLHITKYISLCIHMYIPFGNQTWHSEIHSISGLRFLNITYK